MLFDWFLCLTQGLLMVLFNTVIKLVKNSNLGAAT